MSLLFDIDVILIIFTSPLIRMPTKVRKISMYSGFTNIQGFTQQSGSFFKVFLAPYSLIQPKIANRSNTLSHFLTAVSLNQFYSHRSKSASLSSLCCFSESAMHFTNGVRLNTSSGLNFPSSVSLYFLDSFFIVRVIIHKVNGKPGRRFYMLIIVIQIRNEEFFYAVFRRYNDGTNSSSRFSRWRRSIYSSGMTSHSVASPSANFNKSALQETLRFLDKSDGLR